MNRALKMDTNQYRYNKFNKLIKNVDNAKGQAILALGCLSTPI